MIAIDVKMFPVGASANVHQEYILPVLNTEYGKIMSFFQNLVDQSVVLNLTEHQEFDDHDVTTYFATDMEKAQLFEQKFQDLTAEFSMKKFWNLTGLDTSISFREIDFDAAMLASFATELVDQEFSTIWGLTFPIEA